MTQLAPRFAGDEKGHRRLIADAANAAIRGEMNNTGTVTITAGTVTTTVTDARFGVGKYIVLIPLDATAAALTWWQSSMKNGSCVLGHASPGASASFGWVVIGAGQTA